MNAVGGKPGKLNTQPAPGKPLTVILGKVELKALVKFISPAAV
jgi:hypothetical protein